MNLPPKQPGTPPAPPGERLSAFAQAIADAEKARPVESFDVAGFLGLGDRPIPRVGIRVPVQGEQDRATVAAHAYVDEITKSTDGAKTDGDLIHNAKLSAIAAEFCREVVEKSPGVWEPTGYPAFPSPKWLIGKLAPEQIATLVNLANEYRAKQDPAGATLDDVTVEAYVSVCASSPEPEYTLIGLSREYVVQLLILGSHKLAAARRQMERDAARIAELEALLASAAAPPAPENA